MLQWAPSPRGGYSVLAVDAVGCFHLLTDPQVTAGTPTADAQAGSAHQTAEAKSPGDTSALATPHNAGARGEPNAPPASPRHIRAPAGRGGAGARAPPRGRGRAGGRGRPRPFPCARPRAGDGDAALSGARAAAARAGERPADARPEAPPPVRGGRGMRSGSAAAGSEVLSEAAASPRCSA